MAVVWSPPKVDLPKTAAIVAGSALAAAGTLKMARRLYNEGKEVMEWLTLVRHLLVGNCRRPAQNLIYALHQASGDHLYRIKFRLFGIFGAHVILPRDEGLTMHIATSQKYVRINPLTSDLFPLGRLACRLSGFQAYLDKYLSHSVWCQLDGESHKRQKAVYTAYMQKTVQPKLNEGAYDCATSFWRDIVTTSGPEFDLFGTLQKIMAVLQVELTLGYKLTTCSIERFVEIANRGFEAAYTLQVPADDVTDDLDRLIADMCVNADDEGFAGFFRAAWKDGRLTYEEFKHNVVIAVLLSQQTLPHSTFWPVRRCASSPEILRQVRDNPETIADMVAEEFRMHGPSSPILMPYLALEEDQYGPLRIEKGTLVQMMPSLLHLNPRLWNDAKSYDVGRFSKAAHAKLRASDAACGERQDVVTPSVVSAALVTRLSPRDRSHRPELFRRQAAESLDSADKSSTKMRYVPWGVGRGICPGQRLGLSLVLNAFKALVDAWDFDIVEDKGLLSRPVHEHILVETISRPRNDVRLRLKPRGEILSTVGICADL